MVKRGPYTVIDKRDNVTFEQCTEDDLRDLATDLGIGSYNEVDKLPIGTVIELIVVKGNHRIIYKGEVNMGGSKGKQVKQAQPAEEENGMRLSFLQLLDWSFDELLDIYNTNKFLFNTFGDYQYKWNTLLVMEAMQTKVLRKEVNIT